MLTVETNTGTMESLKRNILIQLQPRMYEVNPLSNVNPLRDDHQLLTKYQLLTD